MKINKIREMSSPELEKEFIMYSFTDDDSSKQNGLVLLGEIIKEEVEYRNIKQIKLAEQIGISYKIMNDILNCRRPLTPQIAMLFEAVLGVSASLLMRIQLDYNMQIAKQDVSFINRLENVKKIASIL